jgi:miniconductance mechanosensitive channel
VINLFENWLVSQGLNEKLADALSWTAAALVAALLAWLANFVAKQILLRGISFLISKSRTEWDDRLLHHHFFTRLSHLARALVFYFLAPAFGDAELVIQRAASAYMIFVGILVLYAFLNAAVDIYNTLEFARGKSIKGFIQVVKIVAAALLGLSLVATLMGKQIGLLLGGLGAMTAVLLFIFKDTILGLIASIQLTTNDMVRVGDWIQMEKYGADGDVIDMTLLTVKVQNWDKTITSIPSYALISDSFRNWRGMKQSGGRRIKRSINIDVTTIKFCTREMLARFEKYQILRPYLEQRRKEIEEWNRERDVDTSELINGRNMTNVGTFRAYLQAFLRNHPKLNQDMTLMVRQLPPTEHGLPIEVYAFSADQAWVNYEGIQADIFDHILAVVPWFDLRVFQRPSGADFREPARQS